MFKVGDRVREIDNPSITSVVVEIPGMPEYEKKTFISSDEGCLLEKDRWVFQKNWELIEMEKSWTEISKEMGNTIVDKGIRVSSMDHSTGGHLTLSVDEAGWVREGTIYICHTDKLHEVVAALMALKEQKT